MSTSKLYCYGKTPRRLRQGPLGAYIDRVAARYVEQGYRRDYAAAAVASVDQFGRWLEASGLKPHDVDEQMLERYVQRNSARRHFSTRIALRHLLDVLREVDACPPPALVARAPDRILEDDFGEYLVKERGLAARTVEHYAEAARIFLAACSAEERRERSTWTAADILTFVRRRAQVRRPIHMQRLCTGLRAFLRYLRFRGDIKSDLASSVPRISRWRLATLPKSLSRAQVQQVLRHYQHRHTAVGRRNYAVLMLLVRLGLRAHEIWSLTLDDIDWRNGHLTIRSKGSGPEPMPLPTDVGKALAAYLQDGRPASSSRAVFVRLHAPHTQLAGSGSVTTIAARTLRAAGVDTPCKGTHVFRYTLATQMLRQGGFAAGDWSGSSSSGRGHDAHIREGGSDTPAHAGAAVAGRCVMSILQDHMRDYLSMRRALGFRLIEAQCYLKDFCAFMESRGETLVTAQLALQWAMAPASIRPTSWAARLTVVRQFARYLHGFEPRTEMPGTRLLPFRPKRSKPYLYSEHEIRQLMTAAEVLPSRQTLRPWTMRTLVGLLAVTGMRVGEALALTREDVDLKNGVLTIRGSKFTKSRLVPVHASTCRALARYAQRRDALLDQRDALRGQRARAPYFFLTGHGGKFWHSEVHISFVAISRRVGLRSSISRHGPRLHDFRHRFATETLLRWSRSGAQIDRVMPTLATYLGHSNISDTYWYLSAHPELMRHAALRLERRWGGSR